MPRSCSVMARAQRSSGSLSLHFVVSQRPAWPFFHTSPRPPSRRFGRPGEDTRDAVVFAGVPRTDCVQGHTQARWCKYAYTRSGVVHSQATMGWGASRVRWGRRAVCRSAAAAGLPRGVLGGRCNEQLVGHHRIVGVLEVFPGGLGIRRRYRRGRAPPRGVGGRSVRTRCRRRTGCPRSARTWPRRRRPRTG